MSENSATSNHKDPASTSQTDDDELVTRDKDQRPGLMKILGKAIGLDITTIAIPVTYNEPTSFLQRMMEYLTYSELLDKANKAEDPDLRTLYVTLFVISSYATTERTSMFSRLPQCLFFLGDTHRDSRNSRVLVFSV
jgi:hypothetical protein